MQVEERREQLLELVRVRRFASMPELAEQLGVSESTVRRDVDHMEESGAARRIHGGVLYTGISPKLPHFDSLQPARWGQKKAIAARAAELIEDGDAVLIDGGTTSYEVARLLVGRPIHVVTNALPMANLFASDPSSELVLIGGNVCARTGVVQGPYADTMIGNLRVRKTVLGVAAIGDNALYNNNLLLVETERAMMKAADEVIVVADSSKFDRTSLARLCSHEEIHHLVTDDGMPAGWFDRLGRAGVNVVVAASGRCDGDTPDLTAK